MFIMYLREVNNFAANYSSYIFDFIVLSPILEQLKTPVDATDHRSILRNVQNHQFAVIYFIGGKSPSGLYCLSTSANSTIKRTLIMVKQDGIDGSKLQQLLFDQYPWAANHDDAIAWITNYMDVNAEKVIKQFDNRILQRVAKVHLELGDVSPIT